MATDTDHGFAEIQEADGTPRPGGKRVNVFKWDGGTLGGAGDFTPPTTYPPSGAAGGDLDGTFPNPTLADLGVGGIYSTIEADDKGRITWGGSLTGAEAMGALGNLPRDFGSILAQHNANQALTDGAWTTLAFNTEFSKRLLQHSTTTNNSRITVPSDGEIILTASVVFTSTAAGTGKYLRIMRNGTQEIAHVGTGAAGTDERMVLTAHDSCSAGTYYEVQAFRAGGGTVNAGFNAGGGRTYSPTFKAIFFGFGAPPEAAFWSRLPSNPVLFPAGSETAVFEPTGVVAGSTLHLYFSAGASPNYGLYHATFDGRTFTRTGRVLGLGTGGEAGNALRSHIYYESGTYYLIYADGGGGSTSGDKLCYATATNPAGPFTKQGTLLSPGGPLDLSLANSCVVKDGSTYYIFAEGHSTAGGGMGGLWETSFATASSLTGTYTWNGAKLTSLGTGDGMYGGPFVVKDGSTWYNWYHRANNGLLPTEVWRAQASTPGGTWSGHTRAWVIGLQEKVNYRLNAAFGTLFSPDQSADPFIIEFLGRTYLFVDVNDNTGTYQAGISAAVFNGTRTQLLAVSAP